jgi:amino acid adenylation domain-containing protein
MVYVPIDPRYPPARRREVIMASSVRGLVVDASTAQQWDREWLCGASVLEINLSAAPDHVLVPLPMSPDVASSDPAYILFTSGSTGTPKGVVITHANAAAFVDWACRTFDVGPGDRVAVHSQLNFDIPVFDIYVTLAKGGTVVPVDEETVMYPQALLNFLRERRITVLYAVPSALNALVAKSALCRDPLPDLRLVLYAGEEYLPGALRRLVDAVPAARVFNLYGPIETNVVAFLEVRPEHMELARIPLGKALDNVNLMLVDADGRTDGEEGEIVIIGECVSPGYLDEPEVTAASRLVINGVIGYRTGDYGSWSANRTLNFLGRRDSLVKVRGFRVELGDVEAVLARHPGVVEAAVVAQPHQDMTNVLTAFLRVCQNISGGEIQQWTTERLPDYMRPRKNIIVDVFPRTGSGKIDRRSLLASLEEKS